MKNPGAGWCWSPLATDAELLAVLERARSLGLLGPGPTEAHLAHAAVFVEALGGAVGRLVDLGSGGGVPGLVLARHWPATTTVLLDSNRRRAEFLRRAVKELELPGAMVVEDRAEVVGHQPAWRGWAEVVVARSFAGPAVTAECAAPLLQVGGRLLVSEPPPGQLEDRWPAEGVAQLGLEAAVPVAGAGARVAVFRQVSACPPRFPRRTGMPAKRPLF